MASKVSKKQLASYSIPENYFFATRQERNSSLPNPSEGIYCAVANNPNVNKSDEDSANWYLEYFNGSNWTLVSISDDYAIIVTNDGLKALTQAETGSYKLTISRVCVREQNVPTGEKVTEWTANNFIYGSDVITSSSKSLLILDTGYLGNTTFTMGHNFAWKINLANGGIQYSLLLDVDTIALDFGNNLGTDVNPKYAQKLDYEVGAIGLFVKDPDTNADVLFAVGNLAKPIMKYTTTATRIGNSVKIYLNTTLSNLGYVQDLSVMPESVGSIPEVVTEEDLQKDWNAEYTPYNLYLVDNLYDSGVPALAVRKGDPSTAASISWTYFTPNDNSIELGATPVSEDVKDYMVVAYSGGIYVPATGKSEDPKPQGIKVGNSVIFDGSIVNHTTNYDYKFTVDNGGTGYEVGETFSITTTGNHKFIFTITTVNTAGKVLNFTVNITNGDEQVNMHNVEPTNECGSMGTGLLFGITSVDRSTNGIRWDFDPTWINKPLYVDYDHTNDSSSEWESYCAQTGLDKDHEPRNRSGKLTIIETAAFVGWCTGTNSIKLALDLRSEATYQKYGTTKYASNDQVKNAYTATNTTKVAVGPRQLYDNYLQTSMPDGDGQRGKTQSNPITVYPYVKFDKVVVGKGMSKDASIDESISFYGRSYRAQWGDLAEFYKSDRMYLPGTLITIGSGIAEITEAKTDCNGIVSDKPGYTLGEKLDDKDLPVALIGKVPVRFSTDCDPRFGDRIYLSKTEAGKASTIPNGRCLGKVIDRGEDLNRQPTILCSVKISF